MKLIDKETGEVKQITIWTSLTAKNRAKRTEISTQPDQTIPDQSMTIRQIMDRHSRGLSLQGKAPIYEEPDEETLGINPKTLDLTDIQQMKIDNEENIRQLKFKHEKETKQKTTIPKAPPTTETPGVDPENKTT